MDLRTVLLIISAVVAALTIVFYQYFYKNPRKGSLKIILAALRFVTLFCGLLLLINPKFEDNDYYIEKANLVLLADHSSSMQEASSENELSEYIRILTNDPELEKRFSVHQFGFGKSIEQTDSIKFDQENTDVSNALSTINEIF